MKLIDKLYVYKNKYGFSTLLKNGEDKMYVPVGFKKGLEPTCDDKATVYITDGFLSFYKDKEGNNKPKIVVISYTTDEQQEEHTSELPF